MTEHRDMSEFLESDSRAMAFYNSLPMTLQQKLYRGGVGAFKELYNAAGGGSCRIRTVPEEMGGAASVSEYTGCVPEGGEQSAYERESYNAAMPMQSMADSDKKMQ